MAKKIIMLFITSVLILAVLIGCSDKSVVTSVVSEEARSETASTKQIRSTKTPVSTIALATPTTVPPTSTPIPTPEITVDQNGGEFFNRTYSIVQIEPNWENIENGERYWYGIIGDEENEYIIITREDNVLNIENGETGELRPVLPLPELLFSIPIFYGDPQQPSFSGILFIYFDDEGEYWIEDSLSILSHAQFDLLNRLYGSGTDI